MLHKYHHGKRKHVLHYLTEAEHMSRVENALAQRSITNQGVNNIGIALRELSGIPKSAKYHLFIGESPSEQEHASLAVYEYIRQVEEGFQRVGSFFIPMPVVLLAPKKIIRSTHFERVNTDEHACVLPLELVEQGPMEDLADVVSEMLRVKDPDYIPSP